MHIQSPSAPHRLTQTACTTSLLPERQFQVQEKVSHLIADLPGELKGNKSAFLLLKPLFHSYKSHRERFGTIEPPNHLKLAKRNGKLNQYQGTKVGHPHPHKFYQQHSWKNGSSFTKNIRSMQKFSYMCGILV